MSSKRYSLKQYADSLLAMFQPDENYPHGQTYAGFLQQIYRDRLGMIEDMGGQLPEGLPTTDQLMQALDTIAQEAKKLRGAPNPLALANATFLTLRNTDGMETGTFLPDHHPPQFTGCAREHLGPCATIRRTLMFLDSFRDLNIHQGTQPYLNADGMNVDEAIDDFVETHPEAAVTIDGAAFLTAMNGLMCSLSQQYESSHKTRGRHGE